MSRQLGQRTGKRVEYESTEVQTPVQCANCPRLKLLLGSVDGLRQEKSDRYLTASDINTMALLSCARVIALLREQDRQCRLSGFELPADTQEA